MNVKSSQLELIGQVACELVLKELYRLQNTHQQAMLRFDGLESSILEVCVNTISNCPKIDQIEIVLPKNLIREGAFNSKVCIFDGNAAAIRNKIQTKQLLVFANANGGTSEDTLHLVPSIKESDILSASKEWAFVLEKNFPQLPPKIIEQLISMFGGFNSCMSYGIRASVDFLVAVTECLLKGNTIKDSVNDNLKTLGYPKYIEAMPSSKYWESRSRWEKTFKTIDLIPTEFLHEQHSLSLELLKQRFHEFKEDILGNGHAMEIYQSLLGENSSKHEWRDLLDLEWKDDKLCEFIGGKKTSKAKASLVKDTINYLQADASNYLLKQIPELGETCQDFLNGFNEKINFDDDNDSRERALLFFSYLQPVLEKNVSLEKKWERLLFSKKIVGSNFISLLFQAAIQLREKVEGFESIRDPVLLVRCRLGATGLFEKKNCNLIDYFSLMYRSLETYFGKFIVFRMKDLSLKKTKGLNPLFHFRDVRNSLSEYTHSNVADNKSLTKEALSLDFDVFIVSRDEVNNDIAKKTSVSLSWHIHKNNIALSLPLDWKVISSLDENKRKLFSIVFGHNFKQTNKKGAISDITLSESSSFGLTSGTMLWNNSPSNLVDLKNYFDSLLSKDLSESLGDGLPEIRKAWEAFVKDYEITIDDVLTRGLASSWVPNMRASYERVLSLLCKYAVRSQVFRTQALSCLLSVGVFSFSDTSSLYALVTPWNPLRLFELHREFIVRVELIRMIIEKKERFYSPSDELNNALNQRELRRWPNFVIAPSAPYESGGSLQCSEILIPIEHSSGYSLYSRKAGPSLRETTCMNVATVREIADISVNSYLRLMPDATNWLHIALPDEISPHFPIEVMKGLLKELPEENCLSIAVGGISAEIKGESAEESLYQDLIRETSKDSSKEESSILSKTIKSRIEFKVLPTGAIDSLGGGEEEIPFDVAYIDRFFTYKAEQDWDFLPKRKCTENPYSLKSLIQHRSRRLVKVGEEYTSTTLLVEDEVTEGNHIYIDAVCWLTKDKSARPDESHFLYPCLKVNCNNQAIKREINSLHKVAHWVVTSNNLIDRRQLIGNQIKIVRYKCDARTGKTCIVSSEISTNLLSKRIANRVREISRHDTEDECSNIANAVLDASYKISGYVALRSARQDKNANEIIGLVLSNWMALSEAKYLAEEQGEEILMSGSFLLDDFEALASNSKKRADLLCMTLARKGRRCKLHLCVTEAKFCSAQSCSEMKSKSKDQLLATLGWLTRVLSDSDVGVARVERSIWFSRFADMIMLFSKADLVKKNIESEDIISFADCVNQGDFDLTINGISHVFIHDLERNAEVSRIRKNEEDSYAFQFVVGTEDIANLLKRFKEEANGDYDTKTNYRNSYLFKLFSKCGYVPCFHPVTLVAPWGLEVELAKKWSDSEGCAASKQEASAPDEGNDTDEWNDVIKSGGIDGAKKEDQKEQNEDYSKEGQKNILSVEGSKASSNSLSPGLGLTRMGVFAPSFAEFVTKKGGILSYSLDREKWAAKATEDLKFFLLEKGVPAKVKRHKLTPNGCLVSFEGNEKLNTREISNFREALLSTRAINVVFAKPMPGEFLVFFNDASSKRESVSMWAAWRMRTVEKRQAGVNLSFIVGLKEVDGELLYLNPVEHDPHTLIAGTTGSGKTVLMQTMLLDMAATNSSTRLKFYIIDPKAGLDYFSITRLPHMAAPLISNQEEARQLLQEVVEEMERRYVLFANAGAKNLEKYNAIVTREKQLPVLFVVHDELPNWMVQPEYAKSVTSVVTQLATKSRAAGIYLIFLAQRPDKDVLPMQVRDNLGNRLVLKCLLIPLK